MTTRDYMRTNADENLSWCRPFVSDDGKYAVAVNEGNAVSIILNGHDLELTPESVRMLAQAVNADYDDYNGYSDLQIALDAMTETSCAKCPWFETCAAMDEEIESAE